jgi:hypothetical protein
MRLLEIVKLFTNGPKAQGEFRFRVPGFEFPGFESGFRAVAAKRKRPKVGLWPRERNAVLQLACEAFHK